MEFNDNELPRRQFGKRNPKPQPTPQQSIPEPTLADVIAYASVCRRMTGADLGLLYASAMDALPMHHWKKKAMYGVLHEVEGALHWARHYARGG